MINAGLYLINSTGSYVYYFQVSTNATYYTNTVVLSLVPTALLVVIHSLAVVFGLLFLVMDCLQQHQRLHLL